MDIDVDVTRIRRIVSAFKLERPMCAGNHKEHVNITSADTAIYAFVQDNTEYVARLRTQCYADVTTSFLVKRRGNTYLDVASVKTTPGTDVATILPLYRQRMRKMSVR